MNISEKTVIVSDKYGLSSTSSLERLDLKAHFQNQVIDLFREFGFKVQYQSDTQQLTEDNYFLDGNGVSKQEHTIIQQSRAEKAGAEMPTLLSWKDILTLDTPVVAKAHGVQKGDGKYLLKTFEDKLNFLAWNLCWQELNFISQRDPDFNSSIESFETFALRKADVIATKAKLNILDYLKNPDNETNDLIEWQATLESTFYFQEFIPPIEGYNTSIRVVVDFTGYIHYAALLVNEQRPADDVHESANPWQELEKSGKFYDKELFLLHPKSPLYIQPEKFVSNYAKGSLPIMIYNSHIDINHTPEQQKILNRLGLNFEQIILNNRGLIFRLSKEFNADCPVMGFDFIINNDKKLLFLESNIPHVSGESYGSQNSENNYKQLLELIKKALQRLASEA